MSKLVSNCQEQSRYPTMTVSLVRLRRRGMHQGKEHQRGVSCGNGRRQQM